MSGSTNVLISAGPTVCLSVVATSHAAVAIGVTREDANYLALVNPGALAVAVTVSQKGAASTLPVDGTPGSSILLPPLMSQPILVPLPRTTPQITAIATAAGPTLIYATPITYKD